MNPYRDEGDMQRFAIVLIDGHPAPRWARDWLDALLETPMKKKKGKPKPISKPVASRLPFNQHPLLHEEEDDENLAREMRLASAVKCTASANPKAAPFSEEATKRCGDPGVYHTPTGPRCAPCAELLLDAVMSPDTILGGYILQRRPTSREEARTRFFKPIQ